MARRYETEELLRLRDSPLAVKPDSLPPAEEWMGPIAEATTQKKHSISREQQSNQTDTPNRRPSLFEPRHISRNSTSDELVLGPPKTSFASATRGFGKSFDAADKSSRNNDNETRNDRYNFRDKFFRDKEFGDKDRDRDPDRRDNTRPNLTNGRRTGRDDKEDWSSGRPRRTFGQEDTDRRVKRGGDSDRWDTRGDQRDPRDRHDAPSERHGRDNRDQGRFPPRREGQGRGRHDPPWFRDGDGQDAGDHNGDKTPVRHREWRRGLHGQDRDWNRSAKYEQEPEWMDPSDKQETKETHTQEDFQRWKERMKAGSNQVSDEAKKEVTPEETKVEAKTADTKRADGEMFSHFNSSFQTDAGMDNFFGLWSEPKSSQESAPDTTVNDPVSKEPPAPARPAKASRFAGIFNPPAETNKIPEPAAPAEPSRPVSTDADQEGFQRILQMLGHKSRNATPQGEAPPQPQPAPVQANQINLPKGPNPAMRPMGDHPNGQDFAPYPENLARAQQNPEFENHHGQTSPEEGAGMKGDTAFLLRLMQQSKISQPPPQPQPQQLPSPGGPNMPEIHARAQGMPQTPGYVDPVTNNRPRPEPNDPRDQLRRRPTGGQGGYFDDVQYHGHSASNPAPRNPPGIRPQVPNQPPGIQRPPGLEQVGNTPRWSNQPPQQSGSNHPMAPPGLSNPPNRNMNPNFPSGPPMPMSAGMSVPNERPGLQRGVSSNGPGGPGAFGPPPGIVPPGYVNMNGPPPSGFPPVPHGPEGVMGMPPGNSSPYGAPQQQGSHHQARQLLEMFSQQGGGPGDAAMGARNGMGMMGPGGYR